MFSWELATTGFLDAIGLRRIKIKIIAFALLATLIPSLTMGWLSYRNNRRAIDEKIVEELTNLTSHASRELDLWFRERRYEMKVLASSYEVSENLEKMLRLSEHIEWAGSHGCLPAVAAFLTQLEEKEWHHLSD